MTRLAHFTAGGQGDHPEHAAVIDAALDHVEIAYFENLQRQTAIRKQHGTERKQRYRQQVGNGPGQGWHVQVLLRSAADRDYERST